MTEKFIDSVPRVAVDLLVLQARKGENPNSLWSYDAIIIRRSDCDLLAVTGGMLDKGEHLIDAAIREFKEETNITIDIDWFVSQEPKVFSKPLRDPRGSHTLSMAYAAIMPVDVEYEPIAQEGEVKEVIRITVADLFLIAFTKPHLLVADHAEIIQCFCTIIANKLSCLYQEPNLDK